MCSIYMFSVHRVLSILQCRVLRSSWRGHKGSSPLCAGKKRPLWLQGDCAQDCNGAECNLERLCVWCMEAERNTDNSVLIWAKQSFPVFCV